MARTLRSELGFYGQMPERTCAESNTAYLAACKRRVNSSIGAATVCQPEFLGSLVHAASSAAQVLLGGFCVASSVGAQFAEHAADVNSGNLVAI